MNLSPYALAVDIVLVAVFALTVHRAWKRGFVDTVAGLLSVIGGVIAARMFGFVLAGVLQRKVFDPLIGDIVKNVIENALQTAQMTAEAAADALTAAVGQALESIRSYTDIVGIPLDIDPNLLSCISPDTLGTGAAEPLILSIAEPIAEKLALWTSYLLLFLIAYAILRFVLRILNVVTRLPILHEANSLLGCVCGVLLGAAYAWITARLLSVVLGILVTRGTLPSDILTGYVFGLLTGTQSL